MTGQVDKKRREQAASARRRFRALKLPGSKLVWQVALEPGARVNNICSADLYSLLHKMEATGLRRAHSAGHDRDPFVEQVAALGVESVYAFAAKPGREGVVRVDPGTYSSR